MTPSEIIKKAKESNIDLWAEQGRLKFKAPKGALTNDLRELIASNRNDIINLLETGISDGVTAFPLTYNQQSLWFLHRLSPQSPSYNVAASCRVLSEIDTDALLSAFEKIAGRHPVLKTTYHLSEDSQEPFQKIHDKINISFNHIDASGWNEKVLKEKVESYYKIPFDLESGPVFRINLFTFNRTSHIFLLTVHHIACDALSLKIILNEFKEIYDAEIKGATLSLPLPVMSYFDYQNQQKRIVNSDEGDRLLSFWKNKLHNIPQKLDLPTDFERPKIQTYAGSSCFFNIEEPLYSELKNLTKETGATLYSILLSVYQVLLAKYSGQNDIPVGTPAFGRLKKEYYSTCGYFINPVVIRTVYDDSMSFREYINKNKKNIFETLEHQDYPFPLLVEKLGIERNPAFSPAFQVLFNLINKKVLGCAADFLCPAEESEPVSFDALKILPFPISQQEGQYDQTLEIIDTEKKLFCVLKYNTDLFRPEKAGRITADFKNLLRGVVNDPERSINEYLEKISALVKKGDKNVSPKLKIAVSATFTIELVEDALNFWMRKLDINPEIVFTPYNQVFQQLLDPAGIFAKNSRGVNLVFIRFDDWLGTDISSIVASGELPDSCIENLRHNIDEFHKALESSSKLSSTSYIVLICPSSPDLLSLSNYGNAVSAFEDKVIKKLNGMSGVYPVASGEILSSYPVDQYYEPMGENVGHIPYTQEFFTAVSTMAARKIFNIRNKPFKVIAVDCDNTLWSGVVGEDGPLGVRIDEDKKWFHQFLIDQYSKGMLICLCSKNVESDVWELFDRNPDMLLKRDHIAAVKINWSPKSQNLQILARELNLGPDSFIFIDDNPIECAEVQAACPEILTIQLPDASADIKHLFENIWVFDHLKVTEEDKKRSDFYKKDREREEFLKETSDFSDFIKGLNLKIDLEEMKKSQVQRFAQMTQRINQFNLSTIRRTESDVEKLSRDGDVFCHTVTVKDRFGDYGLVGAMISRKMENSLDVDSLLLSCRALGKGVEHKMLSHLGKLAKDQGLEKVSLHYSPTKKNIPIRDFLSSVAVEYRSETEDGSLYNIPANAAAEIEFIPVSEQSKDKGKTATDKKTVKSSGESRTDLADLLMKIAVDFSDVRQIHGAVYFNKNSIEKSGLPDSGQTSEISSKIMSVWAEVLHADNVGINDNFFEIGGKSVLIPLIIIQLKKRFDIDISIVDMMQYPTVNSLSGYIGLSAPEPVQDFQSQAFKQKTAINKSRIKALNARQKLKGVNL